MNTKMQQGWAHRQRHPLTVALAGALGLSMPVAVLAQEAPPSDEETSKPVQGLSQADAAEVQQLLQELEALKASYASELRRLRELDMQIQALNARVTGRVPQTMQAPVVAAQLFSGRMAPAAAAQGEPAQTAAAAPARPPEAGYAGTAAEAQAAQEREARSVEDVKEQQND